MALSWEQVQRILVTVMILSFLVAILGGVGEHLGWWDALGEVMMTTGTVVGGLAGIFTLYGGASREQVQEVRAAVVDNGDKLDKLDTLDDIQFELDRQTGVLAQIRDRL